MIFSGILADSKNPAADLRALGLDPQLAKYAGTGAWTPGHLLSPDGRVRRPAAREYVHRAALLSVAAGAHVAAAARCCCHESRSCGATGTAISSRPRDCLPHAQSRAFTRVERPFTNTSYRAVNKWIVFALAGWPLFAVWRWVRERDTARPPPLGTAGAAAHLLPGGIVQRGVRRRLRRDQAYVPVQPLAGCVPALCGGADLQVCAGSPEPALSRPVGYHYKHAARSPFCPTHAGA